MAHALLLMAASWAAWRPVETRPLTGVMLAAVVLSLCVWGWRRNNGAVGASLASATVAIAVLTASAASGWDAARGVGEIGLVVAVAALIWLASRSRPPEGFPELLGLALAGLAIWGMWQIATGLEAIRPGLEGLNEAARTYAEERLVSRRAFASLPLPSHLAVLLATGLPLLLARVRATAAGIGWAIGATVAVIGLAATRSPVGVGLALLACGALAARRSRIVVVVVAVLLAVALVGVVAMRDDVVRLEPVGLRADNWRTALWLFETSPCSGVGLSGFAQASQAVPLEVGNHPAHAHNLALEALAELGPVGLLGCLFLGVWLLRLLRALWPRDPAMAVALAVVPLHNLVDFSFLVSGVAIPWAVLLGWGVARSRTSAEATEKVRGRVVLVLAASVGVAVTVLHGTGIIVEEAAASQLETADRFDGALRSLRLAPWRVEPQFLLASVALESRDPSILERASIELDRHRWWRPGSAALTERRAQIALARGDVSVAASELWASVETGLPDREREEAFRELFTALQVEGHGPPN